MIDVTYNTSPPKKKSPNATLTGGPCEPAAGSANVVMRPWYISSQEARATQAGDQTNTEAPMATRSPSVT